MLAKPQEARFQKISTTVDLFDNGEFTTEFDIPTVVTFPVKRMDFTTYYNIDTDNAGADILECVYVTSPLVWNNVVSLPVKKPNYETVAPSFNMGDQPVTITYHMPESVYVTGDVRFFVTNLNGIGGFPSHTGRMVMEVSFWG